MIQATSSEGALREDLQTHLSNKIAGLQPEMQSVKVQAIADIVIEKLNNESGKSFDAEHYQLESNAIVPFQFRYMTFEQDSMNMGRFRLTTEGYAVYYALNKTVPVDDPNLESAVMEVMLEKGTANHVLTAARQAKAMAYELYQSLQSAIGRAHRAPEKFDWSRDIQPIINRARKAVEQQQDQERIHHRRAMTRLTLSEEEQSSTSRAWRQVIDVMEATARLRSDLISYMRSAPDLYRQAKTRCLAIRPKSSLASLSTDLLPQIFQADQDALMMLMDAWLPLFMPPQRWPRLDFSTMEAIALVELPEDNAPIAHQIPVLIDPPSQAWFSPELRQGVHDWLQEYTQTRSDFTFADSMLQYCDAAPRSYDEQYFFAWTLFNKFDNPVFNTDLWTARNDGSLWDHDYLCADNIIFQKTA